VNDYWEEILLKAEFVLNVAFTNEEKLEVLINYRNMIEELKPLPNFKGNSPDPPENKPSPLGSHELSYLDFVIQEFLHMKYYFQPLPPVPDYYKLPETGFVSNCFTSLEPKVTHSMEEIINTDNNAGIFSNGNKTASAVRWEKGISWMDEKAIQKAESRGMKYLDRKYIYLSQGNKTVISFNIQLTHENVIWLCELQKGFGKYPATMADLDQGALVWVDIKNGTSTEPNKMSKLFLSKSHLRRKFCI
jgi:hypothetical protein